MTEPILCSDNTRSVIAAIDIGGQSLRIGLYLDTGKHLMLFQRELTTYNVENSAQELCIEQTPQELIEQLDVLEQDVANYCQANALVIQRLGICGPGSSFLCWRRSTLEPLSSIISWQDSRGQDFWQGLDKLSAKKITGLEASYYFGAGKYRDCLNKLSAVKTAADQNDLCIGPIASYIIALLSPEKLCAVDFGHAQRSYLWSLQPEDQQSRWHAQLCQHFAIKPDYLPVFLTLPQTLHFAGQSTELTSCWRDQGAALFAQGAPHKHQILLNLGTGVFIQCLAQQPDAPQGWNIAPQAGSETSKHIWEASINLGASSLNWLCAQLNIPLDSALKKLDTDSAETNSGIMTGSPNGLGTPFWRPLSPRFERCLTPRDQLHAWRDNLVFSIALALKDLNPTNLIVSGGLSQTPGLIERLQTLLSCDIELLDDREASLHGCAYLAAGEPSHWPHKKSTRSNSTLNNNEKKQLCSVYQDWQEHLYQRLGSKYEGDL